MRKSDEAVREVAHEAAQIAGDILLEGYGKVQTDQIAYKGEINLVTDYDRRSEEAVVGLLRQRFPRHQVLAEEGTTGGDDPDHRWIIDPLDGTSNYAHGYPCFAVSIAYERHGELVFGVVFDPTRSEWFAAERGAGAQLNGRPIHVSATPDLGHSLLATGFPYDRLQYPEVLRRWERFMRLAQALRRDGSAALDLVYVAAGRFDGFWEAQLSPWDMAAGTLIIEEAGGTISDFTGTRHRVARPDLVASNGRIHAALLQLVPEP